QLTDSFSRVRRIILNRSFVLRLSNRQKETAPHQSSSSCCHLSVLHNSEGTLVDVLLIHISFKSVWSIRRKLNLTRWAHDKQGPVCHRRSFSLMCHRPHLRIISPVV